MFGIDDTLDDIRERIDNLRNDLQDLIPDTPQFREIEFELEELEELEQSILEVEYDPSGQEIRDAAEFGGIEEGWVALREHYDSITAGLGGLSFEELPEEVQNYLRENR
jgi:hypothetical protein